MIRKFLEIIFWILLTSYWFGFGFPKLISESSDYTAFSAIIGTILFFVLVLVCYEQKIKKLVDWIKNEIKN